MPSPRTRAALALAVATLGAILTPVAMAPAALAVPNCSVVATIEVTTYDCDPSGGGSVDITVPARVTSVLVVAEGGGGGANDIQSPGGNGARVSASLTVTPGEVITVYVGSGGGAGVGGVSNVGGSGYGAGGNGGPYWGEGFGGGYGGGGGGSSAVLFGGDDTIIAGGGGGGGGFFAGGSAITNSSAGGSGGGDGTCSIGGGGGNANGLGGAGSSSGTGLTSAATSGFAGSGGNGTYGAGGSTSGGGGGGGGYGGGGPGNWTGPHACLIAGGGGAGGSYGPAGASFGSAGNRGVPGTSGEGGDGSVSLSFIAAPATAPGSPTSLVVSDVTTTSMNLSWTAPVSDGGSPILGYDVVVAWTGGSAAPVRVVNPTYSLTGLTGGVTYSLSITAVNVAGSSTALTGSQQTTAPGTPTGPATGLTFPDRTSSTITADWTPPAPVSGWPTLGYQVRINGGPLTWTTDDSYVARGLEPATTYNFQIYVVNGAGTSTPLSGDETTYASASGPPTNLVFTAVDDTSITASWTAPDDTGGSAITGYWVSVDGGASVWSATTTYTKMGLTPATWHTFAIQAQNGIGASLELIGSQPTEATPSSPRMTATSVTIGSPSTVTLVNFPVNTTQTVMVMAPDASVSNVTVPVNGAGSGTGTYTPASTGTYTLVTAPAATSTTFTASAAPGPGPGPGPGPAPAPSPAITPLDQVADGFVGATVMSTTAFTATGFTQAPTFAIAPALPAGLSIDPQTGVVSGTPTAPQASTEHVITAAAGSQSATATLEVTIVEAPPPPPPVTSILISGRAGMGKRAPRIYVEGTTTGLADSMVVAHVRLPGQRMYAEAGTRSVHADGSFTWSMRTSRRAYVYFTGPGEVRSNRVIIRRD